METTTPKTLITETEGRYTLEKYQTRFVGIVYWMIFDTSAPDEQGFPTQVFCDESEDKARGWLRKNA